MPIRTHFSVSGIPDISANEDRNFREAKFENSGSASDNVAESYIRSFENLDEFKASLDRNLAKFTFAKHSIDEWSRRYCFPDPRTIDTQLRALGVAGDDLKMARRQVINRDHASIEEWTRRNLINPPREESLRGAETVVYIQGTVGSGKSSLNKYITTVLFDRFKAARVIPSRIECQKLLVRIGQSVSDLTTVEKKVLATEFRRFVKLAMMRDIIHYSRSAFGAVDGQLRLMPSPHHPDFPSVDGPAFSDFVTDAMVHCGRKAEEARDIVNAAGRAFDLIGRNRTEHRGRIAKQALTNLDPFVLDVVIGWYQQSGFRFCLMFDGFDYIDASDFYHSGSVQSRIIDVLADWINGDECRIDIACGNWVVDPNVSLTIRRNTRSIIGRKHNQIYNAARARSAYVLSPAMNRVFLALAKDMSDTSVHESRRHSPKLLMRIIDRVRRSIKSELELGDGRSIGSLFNGNVRHQLNYTRDVINELAATALRQNLPANNVFQLLAYINFETSNFWEKKGYRLVDLLLFSAGHRFANFVMVRDHEAAAGSDSDGPHPLTPEDIQDNNIESGYVGNVLNYHIAYRTPNDLSFLLEKIRILELIRQRGLEERGRAEDGYADEAWLRRRFDKNRWPVSPHFMLSLCLLVREGMLEVAQSERSERYSILPLGVVAVEKLITKMVYLENIYFGTLLPEWLHKISDDIERGKGVNRWVASSLFHVWMLLRLVRHAERIGVNGEKTQMRFVHERMRAGVHRSVELMVGAEREAGAHDPNSERPMAIAHARIERYKRDVLNLRTDAAR